MTLNPKRGIALITVLMVSVLVAVMMMAGMGLTGRNVVFVSQVHQRNQALCSAEAGVYALLATLDSTSGFSGPLHGKLAEGSTYDVTFTQSGQTITILSVGACGSVQRKLQVTATLSADAYLGVSSQGVISVSGSNYCNGVLSTRNPLAEPGDLHTNSNANPAISIASNGQIADTGLVSAIGTIQGTVNGTSQAGSGTVTAEQLNKSQLLSGSFQSGTVPASGIVSSNLLLNNDLNQSAPLVLQNGAVLHVTGDVVLNQGVTGQGTIVSDGLMMVRGSTTLDTTNQVGVTLFATQGLTVASPAVTFNMDGSWNAPTDPVGSLFANMPTDAPYVLAERLPLGAPTGIDFFTWYAAQTTNPSQSFLLWRDGDGTQMNPGLPVDTLQWLNATIPVLPQLQQWANGT